MSFVIFMLGVFCGLSGGLGVAGFLYWCKLSDDKTKLIEDVFLNGLSPAKKVEYFVLKRRLE